jgi:hypothetical protein
MLNHQYLLPFIEPYTAQRRRIMPGYVTLTLLRTFFSCVSLLLLLPMVTAAQGTVPVTVEIVFDDPQFGGLGVGLTSISSSAQTSNLVITELAAPQVQTALEKAAAPQLRGHPRTVGGFFRYEHVEFDTLGVLDLDGNIYATNVHLRWDRNNVSYGFLIPYDFLDLQSFNAYRIGAIVYGQYHLALSALATLDLTANGNYTYTAVDTDDLENVNTFGGGVSVTLTLDTGRFVGGGLVSYQFNADDSTNVDDQQHLLKLGATAGFRLGRSVAVALFSTWTYDATAYSAIREDSDADYFDLGLELTWNLSPTWKLTGGYKKILGLEGFDSNMVFLGTLWRF